MRLKDIIREDSVGNPILLSVLSFIKKRTQEKGISGRIKTATLVNMVKNAGDTTFSYETLTQANEKNPAVKNIIKSFNQDEVILNQDGDESDIFNPDQAKSPVDTVGKMAKQALDKRT